MHEFAFGSEARAIGIEEGTVQTMAVAGEGYEVVQSVCFIIG